MAISGLKRALSWPFRFLFGMFTRNKHVLYSVMEGASLRRIEDIIRLKKAFDHVITTCDLYEKNAFTRDKLIVDVGGGSGNTMRIFRNRFPDSVIHVFEPIPSNLDLIKQKDTKNVVLHNCALGSENGRTRLHLTANITSSSLLSPEGPEDYGQEIRKTGELDIEVKRLDTILAKESIGILKMDVQGFELHVLKGCGALLTRTNYVVMEVNNHAAYSGAPTYFELDAFMRDQGFRLMNIFPGRIVSGKLLDWDAIYEKLYESNV